jgi:DNA-binding beta-propeller fold protein YncE
MSNGDNAIDVLGQDGYTTNNENGMPVPNADGLSGPGATAVDDVHHRLFVMDDQNNRILVYGLNSSNVLVNHVPTNVIGEPDFVTGSSGCSGNTEDNNLCTETEGPAGAVYYDSANDKLVVADTLDNRVLIFDTASITDNMSASYILGQTSGTDSSCNQGNNNPSAGTLCNPEAVTEDTVNHLLYVADQGNSRVTIYPLASGTPTSQNASSVIGQSDMQTATCNSDSGSTAADDLCYPMALDVDSTNHLLYIADEGNSRVLGFALQSTGLPGTQNAAYVLGQPNMQDSGCNDISIDANSLCYDFGVSLDTAGHRLFVADGGNNRVLEYDLTNTNTPIDGTADGVIGQTDFTGISCNQGQGDYTTATELCFPIGVTYDASSTQLYAADEGNARVVIYGVPVSTNNNNGNNGGGGNNAPDTDNDGIPDSVEQAAPHSGDANGDNVQDDTQANVTSFVDPVTGHYVSLQTSCTDNTNVELGAMSQQNPDNAFSYPGGLIGFNGIGCGSPGTTVTITEYFYGSFSAPQFVVREWQPNNHTYVTIPGATITNVTIGGQAALKVLYQVKDGSSFDLDGATDGNIKDPTGPGLNSVGAPNTGLGGEAQDGMLSVR